MVNTAARLQTAAPVGAVLVGAQTYEATRSAVRYEAHDPVVAKGKAAPLEVWVALGTRGSVGDALADASTPMVGRTSELAAMRAAFDDVATSGRPQALVLVAEPGLGKSRLVQEFGTWVDGLDDLVTWRQGRCPAYAAAPRRTPHSPTSSGRRPGSWSPTPPASSTPS